MHKQTATFKVNDFSDIYGQVVAKRTDLLEVQLTAATPAAGQAYKLQISQNDYLNKPNILIYGIEVNTSTELAISPAGNTLIAVANLPYLVISLVERDSQLEFVRQYPCTRLRPATYNGYTIYFKPRSIDLDRSLVTITGAGSIAQNQSVCFTVYYKDLDAKE